MLQFEVRVGPVADPASYTVSVAWGAIRHRAEILLVAYLDDVYRSSAAFLVHGAHFEPKANLWSGWP